MKIDTEIRHVTPAGANIFLDLGFDEAEATALKAEVDRQIAQMDSIKEQLRGEVTGWIKANRLKQDEAAEILNVTRPRVSDIVNGKLSKFSIDALINMVIRTGKSVEVVAR
jgi:predicted XRE-type DNA-binding protein